MLEAQMNKVCFLDGKPAVDEVDGYLFRRREATLPVCAEHLVTAVVLEKVQGPARDTIDKVLRKLGIPRSLLPKGAIPRVRTRFGK